jgi:hypothetical protein
MHVFTKKLVRSIKNKLVDRIDVLCGMSNKELLAEANAALSIDPPFTKASSTALIRYLLLWELDKEIPEALIPPNPDQDPQRPARKRR